MVATKKQKKMTEEVLKKASYLKQKIEDCKYDLTQLRKERFQFKPCWQPCEGREEWKVTQLKTYTQTKEQVIKEIEENLKRLEEEFDSL